VRDRDPLSVRHLVGGLVAGGGVVEVDLAVVVQRGAGPLALAERAAVEDRSGVVPSLPVSGVETPDLGHIVAFSGEQVSRGSQRERQSVPVHVGNLAVSVAEQPRVPDVEIREGVELGGTRRRGDVPAAALDRRGLLSL